MSFLLFTLNLAMAGEPGWWTQQKRACGLSSGMAYNTWVAQGSPCRGSGSGSGSTAIDSTWTDLGTALGSSFMESIRAREEEANNLARAKAAQEAINAQDRENQAEASKNTLLNGMMDVQPTETAAPESASNGELALMTGDEYKTDPKVNNDNFYKGFKAGTGCFSASGGNNCVGSTPTQQTECLKNYQAGYKQGEIEKRNLLKLARTAGLQDKEQKKKNSSFTHPSAQGPCRTQWIEAYNEGYMKAPAAQVGR